MNGIDELNAFFRRMPVAFYRTSTTGKLIAANPALANILGYDSVEEMMSALETVETVYMDPHQRTLWLERIGIEGVIFDFDMQLTRPDGKTTWVRDSARAIRDDNGDIVYYEGSLIDVTDKIEAQKEKDDFIATVSHELRNPLAVMLGLGQELSDNYDSFTDDDRREMASMIARQADDASWLIEDLLVAYRDNMSQVSVTIQEFDVTKEIERVLEVVDHPIPLKVLQGSSRILADPRRTRQILRNLVSNAIRYGGEEMQVSLANAGDRLEVKVQDSGERIPHADVERIFRAYERGRGPSHSASVGLGLNVARRLARLMDGDLTYRHEEGWSTFVLSLPSG
ncbi:MAG TPA: PAS domain-containing sensor histidine kinase [Acidimicrobiia bacterium]|nr:PAS domain-containing sensor histidine kinase [Acidimicrobiia bacterium]